MRGFDGNDTYLVDNLGDVVEEFGDDEFSGDHDRVESSLTYGLGGLRAAGIEDLTLTGTAAINGTGNAKNNILTGNSVNNVLRGLEGQDTLQGNDGNDILHGDEGNDRLLGGSGMDFLYGGSGADIMDGDTGDDFYFVDHVDDVVAETLDDPASGYDEIHSFVTYTLGFGIESLMLEGTAAINGTGNAKDNYLFGNDANNVLSGLDGNDRLWRR